MGQISKGELKLVFSVIGRLLLIVRIEDASDGGV
jgi:hypothetical protein